jgi:flagellar biogenesis protein FliO
MAVFPAFLLRPALLACACVLLASSARAQATASPAQPAPAAAQAPTATQAPASKSPDLTAKGATEPFSSVEQTGSGVEQTESGVEEEPESLGWMLTRTLLLFGAVLASIYLTLNVGLRKLMGLQGVATGRPAVVSVVERIPLDQRRTLFVLKAAGEYLLVGGGESGLQLLSKLDTEAVERIRAERPPAQVIPLSPFLQKLLARRDASPSGAPAQPSGTQPPGA